MKRPDFFSLNKLICRYLSDSAMNFELRCRINDVECVLLTTSELNLVIENAFRKSGIKIPRPQHIVRLQGSPNS